MLHPDDLSKTVFRVGTRRYRYRVVPLGLATSAFHIQHKMNKLFYRLIGRGVWIYIRHCDICRHREGVSAASPRSPINHQAFEAQMQRKQVYDQVGGYNNDFGACHHSEGSPHGGGASYSYRGNPLSENLPRNSPFFGMCDFMRRHIPHYSEISKPLSSLVNSSASDISTPEALSAFNVLKTVRWSSSVTTSRYSYRWTPQS